MSELPPGPPDGYLLGCSDAETRRLILEDRLWAEVVGQDGVQLLPAIVGAWARGWRASTHPSGLLRA